MSGKERETQKKKEITYDANGKAINPYIPRFISNAPWYSAANDDDTKDYLSHQRQDPSKPVESHAEPRPGQGIVDDDINELKRPADSTDFDTSIYKKVRVFPKDACTNCGSLNHLRKECLEKPRRITAKSIGVVIDEEKARLKNISDWDSKRDRWNGYDADKEWDNQVKHWKLKEENLIQQQKLQTETPQDEYDEDEAAEMEELGLLNDVDKKPSKKLDTYINTAVKPDKLPVRSRDDKPVYLRNLGGEVTYNPKSRTDRSAEVGYVDDHNQFVRHLNGEAEEYQRLKKFAWDMNKNYQLDNKDLNHLNKHIEASPTAALLELKKLEQAKLHERDVKRQKLLQQYGEVSTAKPPPSSTLSSLSADTEYKEYSQDGVLKSKKQNNDYNFSDIYNPTTAKAGNSKNATSKYEEDVFPGNHKSVWGSFWKDGKWGYACCKQLTKTADCLENSSK